MRKVTWPFFWMHSLIPALPFTENKWRILHMPTLRPEVPPLKCLRCLRRVRQPHLTSQEEEEEKKGHSGHLLPSSSTKWILGRTLHLTVTSITLWLYCKAWNSLYATDLAFLSSTQWSASQTIKKTVEYLRELFCASEYTPNELLESCERLQICFKPLSAALCKLTKRLKLIGDK